MCAMRNRLAAGKDTVRHFAGPQVHDVEPDVFAEADVGEPVPAIKGEREHAAFTNIVDVANEGIVARAEDPQIGVPCQDKRTGRRGWRCCCAPRGRLAGV